QPAAREHFACLVRIRALEPHYHRNLYPHLLHRVDDTIGNEVAAHDAAEDVDQHRAHPAVGKDQFERRCHTLAGGTAADIEKVGGLAAVQLDQVHGCHGESRTVHHAGDIAVERYVVEIVLGGPALHRIFLAGIAQLRELRMTEQGVVVDVDLRIERHEHPLARHDEWIDLDEAQVLLQVELVERCGE